MFGSMTESRSPEFHIVINTILSTTVKVCFTTITPN